MAKKKTKKEIKAQKKAAVASDKKTNPIYLNIFLAVMAGVFAYALYSKSLDYDIVHFDDQKHVYFYKDFNSNTDNIPKTFSQTTFGFFYRPVLGISYILDGSAAGTDLVRYHSSNNFYHALASGVLFLVLISLGYNRLYSLAGTLFFASLPILVPAVSWLPGRNDTLIGSFIFLSFLTMIVYNQKKESYRYVFLILHFLFYAISLFTKEVSVMYPLVAASYFILFKKEKLFDKDKYVLYAGWLVLIAIFLLMRQSVVGDLRSDNEVGISAVITNLPTIPAIIGKIFLPIKMNGCPQIESLSVISGIIVIIAITVLSFLLKNVNKNKLAFGAIWVLLFLLPTLVVIIEGTQFEYMEHRAYLPMLGLLVIIFEMMLSRKIDLKKPTAMLIAAIIIVVFAVRTHAYQSKYEDRFTFWGNVEELHPDSFVGPFNVAKGYFEQKNYQKAEEYYTKTLELNDKYAGVYIDISAVFIETGRNQKAVEMLNKALELDPDNASAHTNIGSAYTRLGDWQKAYEHYSKSIEFGNKSDGGYYNLALAYQNLDSIDLAIEYYNKALKLNPNNYNSIFNLGTVYYRLNDHENAENYWVRATQVQPANQQAHNNLVGFYISKQLWEKAYKAGERYHKMGGRFSPEIEQQLKMIKVK